MKRVAPPEIDMLYAFCLKEKYFDDANFIMEFKKAMEDNRKVSAQTEKRFAQIVLLYKTANIFGRGR